MDNGSDQDVVRKFLRANDSASDGTSIDCKRRGSTVISQEVRVHVSNLDRSIQEAQLWDHLRQAGVEPLKLEIAKRPNGTSNCFGWVSFRNPDSAQEFLQMPIPPLEGREMKLRLDNVSAARHPSTLGQGWVRCQICHSRCMPLLDVLLVEGERHCRDDVDPGLFDQVPTFFGTGPEASLCNCKVISPHPDPAGKSFKLAQVRCEACDLDLGNVQKGSLMQAGIVARLGERVVHLKCASVLLELSDRQDLLLDVRKWQYQTVVWRPKIDER